MTTPIVKAGDPVLRRAAEPIARSDLGSRELGALVKAMVAAMRAAPGVGLAAPQVGVSRRVIVLEDREDLMSRLSPEERASRGRAPFPLQVILNPELELGAATATFFEGCLSVPGYMALVERALEVRVRGTSESGEPIALTVSGWPARILQHEVDHLAGVLYVDRMIARTFAANEEVRDRYLQAHPDDVKRALGA